MKEQLGQQTVVEIIDLWPRRADLAKDLSKLLRQTVRDSTVQKWAFHGRIPARFHYAVYLAGRDRGYEITTDTIVRLHSIVIDWNAA